MRPKRVWLRNVGGVVICLSLLLFELSFVKKTAWGFAQGRSRLLETLVSVAVEFAFTPVLSALSPTPLTISRSWCKSCSQICSLSSKPANHLSSLSSPANRLSMSAISWAPRPGPKRASLLKDFFGLLGPLAVCLRASVKGFLFELLLGGGALALVEARRPPAQPAGAVLCLLATVGGPTGVRRPESSRSTSCFTGLESF